MARAISASAVYEYPRISYNSGIASIKNSESVTFLCVVFYNFIYIFFLTAHRHTRVMTVPNEFINNKNK